MAKTLKKNVMKEGMPFFGYPFLEAYLQEILSVLEHMANIFRKQKGQLTTEEDIVRVENLKHFDSRLMLKTYRNPKLFTSDNGTIRPEKAYTIQNTFNLDIYENRFVLLVLNEFTSLLKSLEAVSNERLLSKLGIESNLNFNKYGNVNQALALMHDSLSLTFQEDNERVAMFLRRINSFMSLLKGHPFYKEVQALARNEIQPTNLLLNDPDYNYVYRFYLDSLKVDYETANKLYLKVLSDMEKEFKVIKKPVKSERDKYLYVDRADYMYNNFRFNVHIENGVFEVKQTSSDGIGILYNLKLKYEYFLPYLEIDDGVKPFEVPLLFVEDYGGIFKAFTFTLAIKNEICPVCGTPLQLDTHHCKVCGIDYNIITSMGQNYIWISNLPAIDIGGIRKWKTWRNS